MTQLVIADLAKCGACALDEDPPCVKAWPPWGINGKMCYVDADDKNDADLVKGTTAVYNACLHGAVQFRKA